VLNWTNETTPTISHQLESKSRLFCLLLAHSLPLVLYQDGRVGSVADEGGGLPLLVPQEGVGRWLVFQGAVWGEGEEVCVVSGKGKSTAVGVARVSTASGGGLVLEQVSVGVVKRKMTYQSSLGLIYLVSWGRGELVRAWGIGRISWGHGELGAC